MMGREAYKNPYLLARVDKLFYGDNHTIPTRRDIVEQLIPYIQSELAKGTRLHAITRHILGLFQGQPGARQWRRVLSEQAPRQGAGLDVLKLALESVS
jgi:tRNA-dihydrouridine synthase A